MKTKLISWFILMLVLCPQMASAAACNCNELNSRIASLEAENSELKQIKNQYLELSYQFERINQSHRSLLDEFEKARSERDYFKEKYHNASLGNITISDFIVSMEKIENHYSSINQSIINQVNQLIQVRNWTIGINLSISVALLSLTFIFFKRVKKSVITEISEIAKIKERNEAKHVKRHKK